MPPHSFSLSETRHVLANTPASLDALIRPLPGTLLDATEGPGTWSPRQVVAHLAWAEIDDWMPRVRRVISGETFAPFDREAGFTRYAGWPIEEMLDEFRSLRAASLAELDALALQPASLQLRGVHPEFGSVTLEQLLATWMTHDFAHVTQIARVLTRHYGQWVGPWKAYFSALKAG
jgi:uncharacterized damage-inducible protein DinB